MFLAPLLVLVSSAPEPPLRETALLDYLARPSPASWRVVETTGRRTRVELISGTEYGRPWRHDLLIQSPARPVATKGAILYVTGDGPAPGDELDLAFLSAASGLTIAMLFDVPVQPLDLGAGPMREDDLIAETFTRHLADNGRTVPLLFPMTRAALRAMDATQALTGADRFVVTGASKRGWTTWLAGVSGDPRIRGVAPMVYDNLNLPEQMRRQREAWGGYSEMIEDYTRRGLQAKLETPAGARLSRSVDPYAYLDRLRAPVLVVNGTNDRYWTVDSFSAYGPRIPTPTWNLEVPNNEHGLTDRARLVGTIGAFARRALAGGVERPRWTLARTPGGLSFAVAGLRPNGVGVWTARSATRDFRSARWTRSATTTGSKGEEKVSADAARPFLAAFIEATMRGPNGPFVLTSPVTVFPPKG